MSEEYLVVRGARAHNLKNISVAIPRNRLTVITGLSGSGKSSLAFDTIYAEGQRRYVESLSAYARQFLGLMEKPDVDAIEGLSPAISIEQKSTGQNPRSTVGTVTEIYDYLRLLWARAGIPHCPNDGSPVERSSATQITDTVLGWPEGTRIEILAPLVRGRKGEFRDLFEEIRKQGFVRARVDGTVYDLAEVPVLNRRQNHDIAVVVDRLMVRASDRGRLNDSIETALKAAEGVVEVVVHDGTGHRAPGTGDTGQGRSLVPGPRSQIFSERFACPVCGLSLPELEPRQFSFNSPFGVCPECHGLGTRQGGERASWCWAIPASRFSRASSCPGASPPDTCARSCCPPWPRPSSSTWPLRGATTASRRRHALLYGAPGRTLRFQVEQGRRSEEYESEWEGVLKNVERRYRETTSDAVRQGLARGVHGRAALRGLSGSPPQAGESLGPGARQEHRRCGGAAGGPGARVLREHSTSGPGKGGRGLDPEVAGPILKEVGDRLRFLHDVGLDYLTLGRSAGSLSGGEAQRIRLATQIGSRLVGVLYILDEPSIGLHQRDNVRLLATLRELRDLGNTVIVVEHDEDTIRAADHVIDLGPRAGRHGGKWWSEGTVETVLAHAHSLTARYLRGDLRIPVPSGRRRPEEGHRLRIMGARANNLQNLTVDFPLGLFVAVTGVSGSGKSSLVTDILYQALARHFYRTRVVPGAHTRIEGLDRLDKVIDIDQSPIGRTPRSNPATYTGLFTPIRELFTQLPEAQACGATVPAAFPSM